MSNEEIIKEYHKKLSENLLINSQHKMQVENLYSDLARDLDISVKIGHTFEESFVRGKLEVLCILKELFNEYNFSDKINEKKA